MSNNNPPAKRPTDLKRRSYLKLAGATGSKIALGGAGLGTLTAPASAASNGSLAHVIIDDFEDADLSEYEFNQGKTGASVVTSPTYEGSYALEISGTDTQMSSMSGLEEYPSAGNTFSYRVRATGGADDTNFAYGVQNHQNKYYVNLDFTNNNFIIFKYENDNSNSLHSTNVTLTEDTWYEVEVQWKTDGTHIATLYDTSGSQLVQASATDTTWSAGGIGYSAYTADGSTIYYDHITLDSGRALTDSNRVIDNFEDSDLAEYTFDQGATGAQLVESPTWGGSGALELSGANTEMISTTGLDYYPSAGDTFSLWVQGTGGLDDVNFTYGVQNHENRYYVNLDFSNDSLRLFKYENGSSSSLNGDPGVGLTEDSWFQVEIDWRKTGTHIATLYDHTGTQLAQVTATDATWADGGIGYDAYLADAGTVYLDYATINHSVVDDFEDGDLSEYTGDTGNFTVQSSTVLEGSQTLKGTNAPSAIAHAGVKTIRGYRYGCSVMIGSGSSAKPALLTSIQTLSTPVDSCYYLQADPVNDTISLYRRDNGDNVLLSQESVTINEGESYRLTIDLRDSLILGSIQDSSGTELAGVAAVDTTYSDGYLGFYLSNSSPAFFDQVTEKKGRMDLLENFEDGDLNEYSGQTTDYKVQSTTVLEGDYSLKSTNNYVSIAHNEVLPSRRYTYRSRILAGVGSGARPGLLACVQDPTNPLDNCYWAQADTENNTLRLIRRDDGISTSLDQINVNIEEGTEYQLAILFNEHEIKAILYNANVRQIAETDAVTDNTLLSGAFGFHSGGSGAPAYFDYVTKHTTGEELIPRVSTTQAVGDNAINTTIAQEVLSELNNPSADTSSATRGNFYKPLKSYRGHGIIVPMDYGKLLVDYDEESENAVSAHLDRSTMPSTLISDLSGGFGWPSSEEGFLVNSKKLDKVWFVRGVTDSERADIISLVNNYDSRNDEPINIIVKNNNGGNYVAIYYEKVYLINEARDTVTDEHKRYGSPSCQTLFDKCDEELAVSLISLGLSGLLCAFALGEPTPVGEYVCAHEVAISSLTFGITLTGPCGDWIVECVLLP